MREAPETVSTSMATNADGVDEVADLHLAFGSGRAADVHMSWRAHARRTSSTIVGSLGRLEIENDRVVLTDRKGEIESLPVRDIPDDSYHAAWFSGIASEFESAISQGPDSTVARSNLDEARNALAVILAARASAKNQGNPTNIAT